MVGKKKKKEEEGRLFHLPRKLYEIQISGSKKKVLNFINKALEIYFLPCHRGAYVIPLILCLGLQSLKYWLSNRVEEKKKRSRCWEHSLLSPGKSELKLSLGWKGLVNP